MVGWSNPISIIEGEKKGEKRSVRVSIGRKLKNKT